MYKILLVDDEILVLESLIHTVEWNKYGFEIMETACSGKEALEKISECHPDVIFTDIQMPGMNGLELIQNVQNIDSDIKFVILSSYAEFAYAQKAMALGASGYCLKPFEAKEIIEYLEKLKPYLKEKRKIQLTEKNKEKKQNQDEEQKKHVNSTFEEIASYVNTHYAEKLTAQVVADQFHVNASYLSQLFKKETGITYTEYVTKRRIKEACRMLVLTDVKIGKIAEQVGISDYFYFTRVFKKMMGISPSDYRGIKEE